MRAILLRSLLISTRKQSGSNMVICLLVCFENELQLINASGGRETGKFLNSTVYGFPTFFRYVHCNARIPDPPSFFPLQLFDRAGAEGLGTN